ncbi:MAG: hypothetical protein B6240_03890 [Desulfobacteraceae bacterium 4572_87]|nr:MAG: hypothetical protein B6240_03890 [Desulfobacteraceae bacterium 4572_87]
MENRPVGSDQNSENSYGVLPLDGAFFDGLYELSGDKALEKVLNHPDCPRLIQTLSSEDFFWLIQTVGMDGSLELLKLASPDQWQYLMDVDTWRKDRLELNHVGQWMQQLLRADPERFMQWLISDQQGLLYYYLFRSIVVEVKNEDEEMFEAGPEFFTLDGFFYICPIRKDQRETIEVLLRTLAQEDKLKYQALLIGLAGVLPAELEEDLYRMRNVRLAEHGFLPREEAIAVYAPLDPQSLKMDQPVPAGGPVSCPENPESVPRWPLQTLQGRDLLTQTLSNLSDEMLLNRIRQEFAGLCNQIASAEGFMDWNMESLKAIQVQAAGYLNMILKKQCHEDIETAETLLRMNSLISLFRAGFGLALDLKWKAERWLKESWFHGKGLEASFWGQEWGRTLTGVLNKRPLYYCGDGSANGFRHFQTLSDLASASETLDVLERLDILMAELTTQHPLNLSDFEFFDVTFYQLLFTLWARQILDLNPSMEAITLKQAKAFLKLLRAGDTQPPFRMFGFEERFLKAFEMPGSVGKSKNLEDALARTWQDFSGEMENIPTDALDAKYSQYILITAC